MSSATDLRAIAQQLKAAQDDGRQVAPITSQAASFDLSSAYAVAHLIHEARQREGAVPVGRKIGLTNRAAWPRLGVDAPMWAYMYDTTVVQLGVAHATYSMARFPEPKIEPEIVVHFSSAPPVDGGVAAILACIDWVAHGFEIVTSHFPGWKFQAADIVADSGAHGALLLGEPQSLGRLGADVIAALERFSLALSCNGAVREVGRGANVLGSPLAAVAQLLAVLAMQPQYSPLQANEIVTTGTLTTALPVQAGETWRTDLDGIALPGLSVEFVM
jgi:2-keto-4-pentenoate hydratase